VPSLSPSSRLVWGALALAVVVLAVVGSLRPAFPEVASTATATGSATSSPATSEPSPTIQVSPSQVATPQPSAPPTPNPTLKPTPKPTPKPIACKPTDQDQYVYHPYRLAVQAACIYVTGVVAAVRYEADGDLHILVALDPAYTHLLTPANQGEELGDLVVEPVCVRPVTQADAIQICAADPDPLAGPFPVVGDKVWMEGRYVFDLDHSGWAELHPLYRWGY
jgi:hypothetical protein